MATDGNTGQAMKHPKQAEAAGAREACRPGTGLSTGPASGQGASPSPPDPVPESEPDTNMSVAGEEDPGAALDLISGGATATPTHPAAAERVPGAGLPRPRPRSSR